ncbi:bifunctional diguanylate cyclase/phosphodiesterase [Neorhizobium alkalisoli]|uniref:Diguanylate cyclase/phosphodiesterase n=1 Tax=Neorhizobium alkalisoli TaxID=528178 RepID=A0A561QSJ2_9HYPH|nr:EAL domain-containing protein [Neorhizobium alkalisoli]TWF53287.1 diguanylate cyclase/phosphodiesterase [Neorhizobium alkalisoli]
MRVELQREILDMLALGCTVEQACNYICNYAEQCAEGVLCSIVTVDRDGLIHPLAGASIAPAYSEALDGIMIGPGVGTCGTAAFLRRPVTVDNIFTDPYWAPYQNLAEILGREHGVKACWSSPIMQSDRRVLGAFGFYYKENRGPTSEERAIVAECVALCALVLEREEVRAENQRLAYFDPLTGLGNRTNFIRTLEAEAARAVRPFGVLLIDIDHLGRINDAFGHATGDRLIIEVGDAIGRIAGREMTFRVDADEFAVLVQGDPASDLPAISKRIRRAMEQNPLQEGDHSLPLSASLGGAICDPSENADVPAYLKHANLALHHAKRTARGNFVLYSGDLAGAITQRFNTLQTVTRALAENRVEAFYQPIVRLDTRQIVGLEALCRIRTDDGQIISAGAFAEALQDLSMGHLLTDRMLSQVARDLSGWLHQGAPLHYVSVNVSMADFDQGDLRQRIGEVFSQHGVPAGNVVIEVTESVYMDDGDRKVAGTIEDMRSDGLKVALDDFGTGYASLTHLLNFPVDIVKIDKTFVDRMSGGAGEVIIKALLDMAAGLDVRIVAEGVETADQALRLQRLGCRYAQGYLFGRAVDHDAMTKMLLQAKQRIPA